MYTQCLITTIEHAQQQSSCDDNSTLVTAAPALRRAAAVYDRFATIPAIPTIPPRWTLPTLPEKRSFEEEEKLHTSFEQAISGRLLAVKQQLDRHSGIVASTRRELPTTDALKESPTPEKRSPSLFKTWQRGLVFTSLACMFLLIGFDLMGVLIILTR
jgi:hypothetical protein